MLNKKISIQFNQIAETVKKQTTNFFFQDMNKLTPDKIEIATLRRVDGKTVIR